MSLTKKLNHWTDAGLITAEQSRAIADFEGAHKGGRFMKGLVGAALFAIVCGVLSIIAANWMDIPAGVKIGAHILVNLLVTYALWRSIDPLRREGLTLLLFGLTLTLIVLIGQVFQLGGNWANALILWLVITTPLMVYFAQMRLTAIPWMLAFLTTIVCTLAEYVPGLSGFYSGLIVVAIGIFLPLALIADGNLTIFQRLKPVWAAMWIKTGFIVLLIGASLASLFWYHAVMPEFMRLSTQARLPAYTMQVALLGICLGAIAVQLVYGWFKSFYRDHPHHQAGALIALLATLFFSVPIVTGYEAGGVAAALHFIGFWLLVGWIAQGQGWHRLVSLSILLITIRTFIIYCELFGSLMTTGFGLISGGVVMLALISGARRLNKRLKVAA